MPNKQYLIVGARGQIGIDIVTYFEKKACLFDIYTDRLKSEDDVRTLIATFADHTVINLAFDKTLNDKFTNVELPAILDKLTAKPPIYVSSNAVYGLSPRLAGTQSQLDAFNEYALQKVEAETDLSRTIIVRGSFLSSQHRLFSASYPKINENSLWNGITSFEFARLILAEQFLAGINTVASVGFLTWGDIAKRFMRDADHDHELLENHCLLASDINSVRPLDEQFDQLGSFIDKQYL